MGKGSSSEPAGSALHTVGSRVWVWKDDWMRGEVVSMSGPRLRVRLEGGDEHECTAAEIPLQNSSAAGVEVGGACAEGALGVLPRRAAEAPNRSRLARRAKRAGFDLLPRLSVLPMPWHLRGAPRSTVAVTVQRRFLPAGLPRGTPSV